MNKLSFRWTESSSLAVELSMPLKQVSVMFEPHGSPMFITLWRSGGTGLRLQSEMHDVAERREVGVLSFEYVLTSGEASETVVDVASKFGCQIAVSKLIVHESGATAESGVILKAHGGDDEILILPSAKPYFLAIRGVLSSVPNIFEPEYPVDRYVRVPFGTNM